MIEQALYVAEDAPDAADAFLIACQHCFAVLADMPQMGTLRHFRTSLLKNVRMFPVRGFEKHLVFYRPCEDGIEIVRVLHASRDIPSILEDDLP
jgi:toxin ParE1/3/4